MDKFVRGSLQNDTDILEKVFIIPKKYVLTLHICKTKSYVWLNCHVRDKHYLTEM